MSDKRSKNSSDAKLFKRFQTKHRPDSNTVLTYFGSALALNLVPLYLFNSIFGMEFRDNAVLFLVVSLLSALIISVGYHNIAHILRQRLSARREAGNDGGQNKNSGRKYITNLETLAFSILYNNALFLAATVFLAFFVFKNSAAPYNYVVSVTTSATALSLFASLAL